MEIFCYYPLFIYAADYIKYMNRFEKRKLTKAKRKSQICKAYELKIVSNRLSKRTEEQLNRLFLEAKWFTNYCVSQEKLKLADQKLVFILVKVKDNYEERQLTVLSAEVKQSIKERLGWNLKSLKALKDKGCKVGKLQFKTRINSIPLRQYEQTFKIDFERKTIKIQKIDQKLKVRGLWQIPENAEIANAILIKKDDDYYLKIVTFQEKEEKQVPETSIGIDFGCETQLTLSNNIKIKYEEKIPKNLKKLDQEIAKKKNNKKSKRKDKLYKKRRKLYDKLTNKKKDIKNKIVHTLTKFFKYICIQNDNIKSWQEHGHGKKIQNTAVGGIKRDLEVKSHTPILVNQYFPSTQLCPECNNKQKLKQEERTYRCKVCGYTEDRDVKAALCIEIKGMKQISVDRRNTMLGAELVSSLKAILGITVLYQKPY